MTLAIHTGIHWRAWLDDPVAMTTAAEIMGELEERLPDKAR